jgi:hypothetical protein
MQLKLNINGSAEPFIKYLEDFYRIRQDLLLEIDPTEQRFVCKISTDARSCVRYSSITFEECNMRIISHTGAEELQTDRIKAGILSQLNKFISIIKRFSINSDKDGNVNFNIVINYDKLINADKSIDYVATKLACVSDILTMRIDGFRISELVYIDDNKFNTVVFGVEDPVTFKMDANTINSLIKNSDIMKSDERTDAIIFYNKDREIWAKSIIKEGMDPTFEYKIGDLNVDPMYNINFSVRKKNFTTMLNKTDEDYTVIIGRRTNSLGQLVIDRILFKSLCSDTKIAIAIINE